jgi:hypothetical protein
MHLRFSLMVALLAALAAAGCGGGDSTGLRQDAKWDFANAGQDANSVDGTKGEAGTTEADGGIVECGNSEVADLGSLDTAVSWPRQDGADTSAATPPTAPDVGDSEDGIANDAMVRNAAGDVGRDVSSSPGAALDVRPALDADGVVDLGTGPEDVTSVSADVYANVHILSDDVSSQAVFSGSTLFFPASAGALVAQLQAGDVIVSGLGSGFILKVMSSPIESTTGPSVTPNRRQVGVRRQYAGGTGGAATWIAFQTTTATFLDVFRNIDATLTLTLPSKSQDNSGYIVAGNEKAGLMFSQALVSVGSTLRFNIKIVGGKLVAVSTGSTIRLDANYALKLFAQGQSNWSASQPVWTSPPIPIRFQLGVVPVVSSLVFDLVLGADASAEGVASIEIGKSCSDILSSTASWTASGGWNPQSSSEINCSTIGPNLTFAASASAVGKLTLESRWSFGTLFGAMVGGLTLAVNAHVGATAILWLS